jgi:hypothetical protein
MITAAATTCLYVFGIVDADRPVPASIDGTPLDTVTTGGVAAVHRTVDPGLVAAAVAEPAGDALAFLARLHDEVLTSLAVDGPVLPVRFATMCADASRLTTVLQRSQIALREALDAVRGRSEWTLRVEEAPRPPASPPAAGSGHDYLLARRRERDQRLSSSVAASELVGHLDARVTALAERSRDLRNLGLLSARAHLVDDDRRSELSAVLAGARRRFDAAGLVLRVDGPLPPYSFADVRLEVAS